MDFYDWLGCAGSGLSIYSSYYEKGAWKKFQAPLYSLYVPFGNSASSADQDGGYLIKSVIIRSNIALFA